MGGGSRAHPSRFDRRVRIDAAAAFEIRNAILWYQHADPTVATRFALAIDHAIERARLGLVGVAVRLPGVDAPIRRLLVARFPYAVYYLLLPRSVRILAIAHQRRRPGYWLRQT